MARLTRAQQQRRTRAAVLAAARREFAERGYAEARIDRIADGAELTRGAVYSNFPSKRALYLAVLVDMVEGAGAGPGAGPVTGTDPSAGPADGAPQAPRTSPATTGAALGAFARAWLERLPLIGDTPEQGHLQLRSLDGVLDDTVARTALAQASRLEALLLALTLEAHRPLPVVRARRVRLAELVLTLLHGAGALARTAPGFGDPFDVARACEHLADMDLTEPWDPPHLPYVSPAAPTAQTWTPPTVPTDALTGRQVDLAADGVIAVLGSSRLAAAEEAVRAARRTDRVTVVAVTGAPAEIGRLVRVRMGDLAGCLRRVFAPGDWPAMRLVLDDHAVVAAALDVPDPGDATETAVRIADGTIVARATGRGAAYAAASADAPRTTRPEGNGA